MQEILSWCDEIEIDFQDVPYVFDYNVHAKMECGIIEM